MYMKDLQTSYEKSWSFVGRIFAICTRTAFMEWWWHDLMCTVLHRMLCGANWFIIKQSSGWNSGAKTSEVKSLFCFLEAPRMTIVWFLSGKKALSNLLQRLSRIFLLFRKFCVLNCARYLVWFLCQPDQPRPEQSRTFLGARQIQIYWWCSF